jgi:hypothetical protein
MISTFLLQSGAGCLLGVLPVPASATGRAFNRFVAALAALILILGLGAASRSEPVAPSRLLWWMAVACSALSAGLSHAGRIRPGRFVLYAASAWAAVAIMLDASGLASRLAGGGILVTGRYALDALSASWLLGAVLIAMILGHYYLNIAGLAMAHLVRLCLLAVAAAVLRGVVFGWSLFADGPAILAPFLGDDLAGADLLPAVVLVQRFLFGIVGTAALCLMAWRTAKISSTQSATGILYIALIAVLTGELASRYLLFTTGVPL